MPAGHVYILSNPSLRDGLLKVGRTTVAVESRVRGLRGTGVPTHFKVEYFVQVEDCGLVETVVHRRLAQFRYAPDREFFAVTLDLAISVVDKVVGETKDLGTAKSLEKEWQTSVRDAAADSTTGGGLLAAFEMRVDQCSEAIQRTYRALRLSVKDWPQVTFKVDATIAGMTFYRDGRRFVTLHPKHSAKPNNVGVGFFGLPREEVRAKGVSTRDHLKQDGVWTMLFDDSSIAQVVECARLAYLGDTKDAPAGPEKEGKAFLQEAADDDTWGDGRLAKFEMRVDRCSETIREIFRSLRASLESLREVTFKVDKTIAGLTFYRSGRRFVTLHPKYLSQPNNIGIGFFGLSGEQVRAAGLNTRDYLKQDGVWIMLFDEAPLERVIQCAGLAWERAKR